MIEAISDIMLTMTYFMMLVNLFFCYLLSLMDRCRIKKTEWYKICNPLCSYIPLYYIYFKHKVALSYKRKMKKKKNRTKTKLIIFMAWLHVYSGLNWTDLWHFWQITMHLSMLGVTCARLCGGKEFFYLIYVATALHFLHAKLGTSSFDNLMEIIIWLTGHSVRCFESTQIIWKAIFHDSWFC